MLELEIDNIAGIISGSASLMPGVNVVQASNFRGKSSFVTAIETVMGADDPLNGEAQLLTEGQSMGAVTLSTGDATFETVLERRNGTVARSGETYLEDPVDRSCARLFAFLDDGNPIRMTVRSNDPSNERLSQLLLEPLELRDIEGELDELRAERERLREELEVAREQADREIDVHEHVTELEKELASYEERRQDLEVVVKGENSEHAELAEELGDRRTQLDRLDDRISTRERAIERREERLSEVEDELAAIELPAVDNTSEETADELSNRNRELRLQIGLIEDVIGANEQLLESSLLHRITEVNHELSSDRIDCWICGSERPEAAFEGHLDRLKAEIGALRDEKADIVQRLQAIERRRADRNEKQRRVENLESKIAHLKRELEENRSDVRDLRQRRDEISKEISGLEDELESIDSETSEELSSINAEIGRTENELRRQRKLLEEARAASEEREELERRLDEIEDRYQRLKTEKASTLQELTDQFDGVIDDIITRFEPGFDGSNLRRLTAEDETTTTGFELSVVRSGREIPLANLSEGETELVGIALALAGYRTFDVKDRVPLVLLDGIGQLAAEHIHALVGYLETVTEVVVVTAYPEAGTFDANTISPDDWTVVSDEVSVE